jgi:hypothetical protein
MTTDRQNYDVLERIALDLEILAGQLRRVQTSIFKDKEGIMEPRKSMIELQEQVDISLEKSAREIKKMSQPTLSQEKLSQLFELLIAELRALNEKLDGNEPTA